MPKKEDFKIMTPEERTAFIQSQLDAAALSRDNAAGIKGTDEIPILKEILAISKAGTDRAIDKAIKTNSEKYESRIADLEASQKKPVDDPKPAPKIDDPAPAANKEIAQLTGLITELTNKVSGLSEARANDIRQVTVAEAVKAANLPESAARFISGTDPEEIKAGIAELTALKQSGLDDALKQSGKPGNPAGAAPANESIKAYAEGRRAPGALGTGKASQQIEAMHK